MGEHGVRDFFYNHTTSGKERLAAVGGCLDRLDILDMFNST
jgi:hypothetical protein